MSSFSVDYDYKFLTEPDDALTCRICLKVAKNPKQHIDGDCGMLFCRECIEKWGMDKPCPNCRMEHPNIFDDARSKREIRALGVKCDNVDRDCQWKGTVGALEEHMDVCEFTLVPCPNECKNDVMISRKRLKYHLTKKCPNRDYSCKHCDLKGTYATTLDHYDTCDMKIITCTNEECTMRMERMKIKNHLTEECEHTVISCKYMSIGCDMTMKRKDMRAHEQDDKAHLSKALDTVVKLEHYSQSPWERKSITFKLTQFQKKKSSGKRFKSPSFYTSPNGYHMKIRVDANGNGDGKGSHVSGFVNIVEGKHDDDLNWPFVGDVTIELLNQLEDKNHYSRVLPLTPEDNMKVEHPGLGYTCYISHSELSHDWASNTQYLKDDTLYFKISIKVSDHKPWLQCTQH